MAKGPSSGIRGLLRTIGAQTAAVGAAVWGAISGTFTDQADAVAYIDAGDAAALAAAQAYTDAATVGLWDDRGLYDASSNVFPSSGGSGTAGAILKGDIWTVSVAGTLGGHVVAPGDTVRALVDTPGSTDANWGILDNNVGYVPENSANKTATIDGSSTSSQYPNAQATHNALALKQNIYWGQATGTANALAVTLTPTLTAYGDATLIRVRPTLDNTNATVTIDVDGLGATPIKKNGGNALDIGDIQAIRDMFLVYYDSGLSQWFELLNPAYDATGGGSGSVDTLVKSYAQTAHGLVVGQPVYWNGTIWVIADADSDTTAARGFVSTVTDANNIIVTFFGRTTLTAAEWLARTEDGGNLVAGETYWLSTTAGKITKTQPTSGYSQELGYAESTTVFVVSVGPVVSLSGGTVGYTVPLASAFTVFGSGLALSDKVGRLQLSLTTVNGNLRGATRSLPSTPYTIDMAVNVTGVTDSAKTLFCGITVSDGTIHRTLSLSLTGNATKVQVLGWATATSAPSVVLNVGPTSPIYTTVFLRVTDNGTTRSYYISQDGKDFILCYSEGRTTGVTPTVAGVAIYNDGTTANLPVKAGVFNYLVSSSVLGDAS